MIYRLTRKIEAHIDYCKVQIKIILPTHPDYRPWVEEKESFEKVLLDLYKIRDGKKPDTNYNEVQDVEDYYK